MYFLQIQVKLIVPKTKGLPLRIMFQDEARFGRISSLRACWAPMPMRPKMASQIVREYVYVFGAVSPFDGKHDSLVLPHADTEAMSLFLGEISRRYPWPIFRPLRQREPGSRHEKR